MPFMSFMSFMSGRARQGLAGPEGQARRAATVLQPPVPRIALALGAESHTHTHAAHTTLNCHAPAQSGQSGVPRTGVRRAARRVRHDARRGGVAAWLLAACRLAGDCTRPWTMGVGRSLICHCDEWCPAECHHLCAGTRPWWVRLGGWALGPAMARQFTALAVLRQ